MHLDESAWRHRLCIFDDTLLEEPFVGQRAWPSVSTSSKHVIHLHYPLRGIFVHTANAVTGKGGRSSESRGS